jgi:hypothetical protein
LYKEKEFAYCGLACGLCSHGEGCAGCRNGGCEQREWCRVQSCCREKGYNGCWECAAFPCEREMLQKPRVQAFIRLIGKVGEEEFSAVLEQNERAGVLYHHEGKLTGDYDAFATSDEVERFIFAGREGIHS